MARVLLFTVEALEHPHWRCGKQCAREIHKDWTGTLSAAKHISAAEKKSMHAERLNPQWTRRVAGAEIALMFMGSSLLTPLYGLYRDAFGFSQLTLTLVYASYVIGNLGALFLFGRLSDQIGRKRVSLPAIVAAGIATVLFLFAHGTAWLFVARALSGLAIGLASGAAAAWITELTAGRDSARSTVTATSANAWGLAIGTLLSGMLAEYAPAPLQLSFVVYLLMLVALALLVTLGHETVATPVRTLRDLSLRPRVGVPRQIRARFVPPAVMGFAAFALVGFYAALAPTVLRRDLHQSNLALISLVVVELFAVAALSVHATKGLSSRRAMLASLVLLVPSVVLLVIAQAIVSMPVLLLGTTITGICTAMGYRGSLQVVNEIAPGDKRAEVLSSYFVVCFAGNSIPVVAVGFLASTFTPVAATGALATMVTLLAAIALAVELRHRPQSDAPAGSKTAVAGAGRRSSTRVGGA
jgi:MFS family permease